MGKQGKKNNESDRGRALRRRFLRWQCDIRQTAMRDDGGRPSPGMCPRVVDRAGREIAASLTVLLKPKHPEESTAFFRFQVRRSADPRDIYQRALTYLQSDYFQDPKSFSDELLAVLPQGSPTAAMLIDGGECGLEFAQAGWAYGLPCAVRELAPGDAAREAALWHNRVFNPGLPDTAQVLAFKPDWASTGTREGSR